MNLQLLICTIDAGIGQVEQLLLTQEPDITYLVSWQHSATDDDRAVPTALMRTDVTIVHLEGQGLSRNRNNCLRHATGDICLLCDDDCRYTSDRLRKVIDTFVNHPDTDLATFMMQSEYSRASYPLREHNLAIKHKGYFPSSVEIAFRRDSIVGRLQFNENFGLRAPIFQCSEEEIFVHDALKLGLRCIFYPVVVVEHDHPTTEASRATQPGVLMAMGAFLYIGYRPKMLLHPLPMAWRLHKRYGVSVTYALRYLYKGLFHIMRHHHLATAGLLNN